MVPFGPELLIVLLMLVLFLPFYGLVKLLEFVSDQEDSADESG